MDFLTAETMQLFPVEDYDKLWVFIEHQKGGTLRALGESIIDDGPRMERDWKQWLERERIIQEREQTFWHQSLTRP